MEMPTSLKTLPPEALDALRYYGRTGQTAAYPESIMDGAGLSERAFGKAIRRLVTKSYMMMDGSQQYRLTENGRRLLAELLEYDLNPDAGASFQTGAGDRFATPAAPAGPRFVRRRLVLALPASLVAGQPTNAYVGFAPADAGERADTPIALRIRMEMLHGEPEGRETALLLDNRSARQVFELTAGAYQAVRVRVLVMQNDAAEDESGGLYLDVPVEEAGVPGTLTAYGADLMLMLDDVDSETARFLSEFDF